jgi:solute carrier family 25 phosphate transporter 3
MLAATMSIVKSDGAGVLLSGLGPTVVGYGIEGAMKFGIYEVAKPVFGALLPGNKALAFCFSSVIAGSIAALLLCPMESLRIRQVTDASYANDSLLTGLPKLIRNDGVASLFGGVWAMLAKQVCTAVVVQEYEAVHCTALYLLAC